MSLKIVEGKLGTATFSLDEKYRYDLIRNFGKESKEKIGIWVGLNPSTATADVNDPTIRRCIDYTKQWGASKYVMLNLFGFRATDPKDMKAAVDPIGPDNDHVITQWLLNPDVDFVVCAWGSHGSFMNRSFEVASLLQKFYGPAYCLGVTKSGEPKHPLYLSKNIKPEIWTPTTI